MVLEDPQTDVKAVKTFGHFEAENIYFPQENKIRRRFKKG
jgi:hypothetical protein